MRNIGLHHLSRVKRVHKHPGFHFFIDLLTLVILLAVMIFGPLIIIVFMVWIEQYIHSDGAPNEQVQAVGQWAFIVQIGILLLAAVIIRVRYRILLPPKKKFKETSNVRGSRLRSLKKSQRKRGSTGKLRLRREERMVESLVRVLGRRN